MILCRRDLAERIDKAVFPFVQGGPLMHVVAAKAVALAEAATPGYREYAHQVIANARALAEGLAAAGLRPVSGGTDTHLALIDLRELGVTGREAEERCDRARITLNKNAIPYDPQKPTVASGIRVGTPSVTTQGMREPQMREIAELIAAAVLAEPGSPALAALADQVSTLVAKFPAYPPPGALPPGDELPLVGALPPPAHSLGAVLESVPPPEAIPLRGAVPPPDSARS
jgi:glycine hydroxymethyltransferase